VCVCVCVCVRARARARAHTHIHAHFFTLATYKIWYLIICSLSFVFLCDITHTSDTVDRVICRRCPPVTRLQHTMVTG